MSNKKFNLKDKLINLASDNSGPTDEHREVFPPVIDEEKKSFSPPKFNKEKFENLVVTEQVNEEESYVEGQLEKIEKHDQDIVARSIKENSNEIIGLKHVRKSELDSFFETKKSLVELKNKDSEVKDLLSFEKSKNEEVRTKLSDIKLEISGLSGEIEKRKTERLNLEIENDSVTGELNRLMTTRDSLDVKLAEISKESSEISTLLANGYRDKNDLINLMNANKDLIDDFKKKIIIHKENINSLRDEIEFKNKQIVDQNSENELLNEEISQLNKKKESLNRECKGLELDLEAEEKNFEDLKEKILTIKEAISLLENKTNAVSNKRRKLSNEYHEYEGLCTSLTESKKQLEAELDSKNEIITNYDSKIALLQEKSNHLSIKNGNLKENVISRKREIEKLQKVFEVKKSKIERVEISNYDYERETELLKTEVEELKVHKSALERRLSSLNFDTKSYQTEVKTFREQLNDLVNENQNLDKLIASAGEQREISLEKISNLRFEIYQSSSSYEQRVDELAKAENDNQRQSKNYSQLKSKKEEITALLQEVEDKYNKQCYELKKTISEKRDYTLKIERYNDELINLQNKITIKSNMLGEIKDKKVKLLDEKLVLEERVNKITMEVTDLDSSLYSEKEIVMTIQKEVRDVNDRIEDIQTVKSKLEEDIEAIKEKKKHYLEQTDIVINKKRVSEAETLKLERELSDLQSDVLRLSENNNLVQREYTVTDAKFRNSEKVAQELNLQKKKLSDQIATRKTLIEKKREEQRKLSNEEVELTNEIEILSRGFKSSNSEMITSTMDVKNLREDIKRQKEELKVVKEKYLGLTSQSKELKEDSDQQMVMINELNQTKNKYLSLIEELSVKNSKKFSEINEKNKVIENLKDEVSNLKENVHLLNNYRKKKAA